MTDLFDASPPLLPANRLIQPLDACLDAVPEDWRPVTQAWRRSAAGQGLLRFVAQRQSAGAVIYPASPLKALALTPLSAVRAVILGQDPYHGPGQAEGLAFSVPRGVKLPPSLRNIFVEWVREASATATSPQPGQFGVPTSPPPTAPLASSATLGLVHGHLGAWATQGVLLLNTCLTVEDGQPASHAKRGWEALTDALIHAVAEQASPVVFLLWGAHAQAKAPLIEALAPGRHVLLQANHPSPLSARRGPHPFIGCGHFGALARHGLPLSLPQSG